MNKSPLMLVKERFESKEKLVEAVTGLATTELWLDRVSAAGLARVSNAKLLKLHGTLSAAKERFGSRAALIEAIIGLAKRSKDAGYRARVSAWPTPRLLDLHASLQKGSKAAAKAKKPAPAAAAAKPATAKPRTKKAKQKAKAA